MIAVLFGAPRRTGETGRLVETFLSQAPAGAQVHWIEAYRQTVAPCDGCGRCSKTGVCRMEDLCMVYEQIEQADVLLVATPVYYLSMPAPLKMIFDRMQPYWSRRFCLNQRPADIWSKKGMLLTVSGSESSEGGEIVQKQTRLMMSLFACSLTQAVHVTGSDEPLFEKRREQELERVRCAATAFFRDTFSEK